MYSGIVNLWIPEPGNCYKKMLSRSCKTHKELNSWVTQKGGWSMKWAMWMQNQKTEWICVI